MLFFGSSSVHRRSGEGSERNGCMIVLELLVLCNNEGLEAMSRDKVK
jgi:hypothetical protein